MLGRFFRPGGRETTVTSIKTEITKDVLAALIVGIAGNVIQTILVLIVFIFWWKIASFTAWWRWFREWWTFCIAFLLLWWIAPAVFLIIRLVMELWDKHWPPVRQAADPALGILGPFQRREKKDAMLEAYLAKYQYRISENE